MFPVCHPVLYMLAVCVAGSRTEGSLLTFLAENKRTLHLQCFISFLFGDYHPLCQEYSYIGPSLTSIEMI